MINIFYTIFKEPLPEDLYDDYLTRLPVSLQEKNVKYRRWQDRHSHLFGKLLLLAGLKNYGYTDDILNEINYNQYSRPFIDGDIDFNISHSGAYVLCAIGKNIRLGVDIEEIKEVNFDDFRQVMTTEQWLEIKQSADSKRSFFKYWTIKESVIKADSRGLSIPLQDIHVHDNKVCYDNQTWYLEELKLDKQYSAFLTADKQDVKFVLKYMDFYESGVEWKTKQGEGSQVFEIFACDLMTKNQ